MEYALNSVDGAASTGFYTLKNSYSANFFKLLTYNSILIPVWMNQSNC